MVGQDPGSISFYTLSMDELPRMIAGSGAGLVTRDREPPRTRDHLGRPPPNLTLFSNRGAVAASALCSLFFFFRSKPRHVLFKKKRKVGIRATTRTVLATVRLVNLNRIVFSDGGGDRVSWVTFRPQSALRRVPCGCNEEERRRKH